MALRPVHRIKHVVDLQGATVAGTASVTNLVVSQDNPVLAGTTDVETGSKINGIYLRVEIVATTSAALPNCYLSIFKNNGGNDTAPAANAVGASDSKRFVIHQEMLMLQPNQNIGAAELGGNPRTLFNGVIVLPRGYRRFGPNDLLQISILAPGVNINFCYQAHFKEYR